MRGWIRARRRVVSKDRNRIDRQLMFLVKPREVFEHTPVERLVRIRLRLDVKQKEPVFRPPTRLHHQVGLVLFARSHVGEQFLVEEFQRIVVNLRPDFREEKFEEFQQEGAEQFFEKPIVINSPWHHGPPWRLW